MQTQCSEPITLEEAHPSYSAHVLVSQLYPNCTNIPAALQQLLHQSSVLPWPKCKTNSKTLWRRGTSVLSWPGTNHSPTDYLSRLVMAKGKHFHNIGFRSGENINSKQGYSLRCHCSKCTIATIPAIRAPPGLSPVLSSHPAPQQLPAWVITFWLSKFPLQKSFCVPPSLSLLQ